MQPLIVNNSVHATATSRQIVCCGKKKPVGYWSQSQLVSLHLNVPSPSSVSTQFLSPRLHFKYLKALSVFLLGGKCSEVRPTVTSSLLPWKHSTVLCSCLVLGYKYVLHLFIIWDRLTIGPACSLPHVHWQLELIPAPLQLLTGYAVKIIGGWVDLIIIFPSSSRLLGAEVSSLNQLNNR